MQRWNRLFIACALGASGEVFAQNVNNETNVYIPAGLEVATSGSFINSGFIQNNGTFSLAGHWMNVNVYQGRGVVVLTGGDQIVSNNGQSFEALDIEGGGIKTLQGRLLITGRLGLRNGVLRVADADSLFFSGSALAKGGSPSSFIDGAMISRGTGYKFFPIGKNGSYHPVELLEISGVDPVVEVEVRENLPEITTAVRTDVDQSVYWTRKTVSGSYDGSPMTFGYQLGNTTNLSRLVILHAKNIGDEFAVSDNVSVQSSSDPAMLGSTRTLNADIFAIGELLADPPRKYYFSTTLSPNASDPDNRVVRIFGDGISNDNFYFQVFNRWGLNVYESKSAEAMANNGWDGRQSGTMVPSGVYPYSLKYIDTSSGKTVSHTGFITVIQ